MPNTEFQIREIEDRLIDIDLLLEGAAKTAEGLDGDGNIVNHGHRLEVDKSTRISELASIEYVDTKVVDKSLYAFKTITGITEDVIATGIGDTLTLASGNSLISIVGVTVDREITFTFAHLGFEDLTGPDGDHIVFWDDGEGALKWLGVGDSIVITATTMDTIQDIRTTASPTFGVVYVSDGAAATPSYSFTNSTNSGMFWDAGKTGVVISNSGAAVSAWYGSTFWLGINCDIDGNDLILDSDGDTYLHESADDVIDLVLATASGEFAININGAEDFKFTANTFTGLTGSSMVMDTMTIGAGSITDSGGAITFGNETLATTGSITGNSFITAQDIGIAADTDLIQLTGSGLVKINGTLGVGNNALTYVGIYNNLTTTRAGSVYGGYNSTTWTPSGNTGGTGYGINMIVDLQGTKNVGNLYTFHNRMNIQGSGSIGSAYVFRGEAKVVNSTRTVTNFAYLSFISTLSGGAALNTTTAYQIYLEDYSTIINATNTYGIKQEGVFQNMFDGVIKIKEAAAAVADTAGYGQLWIKNTTPCELWFTDDAGTDTQIV